MVYSNTFCFSSPTSIFPSFFVSRYSAYKIFAVAFLKSPCFCSDFPAYQLLYHTGVQLSPLLGFWTRHILGWLLGIFVVPVFIYKYVAFFTYFPPSHVEICSPGNHLHPFLSFLIYSTFLLIFVDQIVCVFRNELII